MPAHVPDAPLAHAAPRLRALLLTVLLGAASLGCVLAQTTDGTRIPDGLLDYLTPGVSTRADVVHVLGAPDKIIYSNLEHDPLFERAFQFKRTRRKTTFFTIIIFSAARTDRNADIVTVFFDEQGVVEDIAYRLDMDRPRYGMPWGDEDDD